MNPPRHVIYILGLLTLPIIDAFLKDWACSVPRKQQCYRTSGGVLIKSINTNDPNVCCALCNATSDCATWCIKPNKSKCFILNSGAKISGDNNCTSASSMTPILPKLPFNKYGSYAARLTELAPEYPFISGTEFGCDWGLVEAIQGKFNFSACKTALDNAVSQNKSITINPQTGAAAPLSWFPSANIPVVAVCFKNKNKTCDHPKPEELQYYPYYLAPAYHHHWKRYHQALHDWIVSLSADYRKRILSIQVSIGSTGDITPWHGTPANASYVIERATWNEFWVNSSLDMVTIYSDLLPDTHLLFNGVQDALDGTWPEYGHVMMEVLKPPNFWIKCGVQSHQYMTNFEVEQFNSIGNLTRTNFDGQFVRSRGEMSDGSTTDPPGLYFWLHPTWNLFSMVTWDLTFGLDMLNPNPQVWSQELGPKGYWTPILWRAFEHYHTYAGVKQKNESTGAWILLRDALDHGDDIRFPNTTFGPAELKNIDRVKKIVGQFAAQGAAVDDMAAATAERHKSRARNGLNDAGFHIWPTNYGNFITQLITEETSRGRWRIGDKNGLLGRFARQTIGPNHTMFFAIEEGIFLGKQKIFIRVAYFNEGVGTWKLTYQDMDGTVHTALNVKKTNTQKWIEARTIIKTELSVLKNTEGVQLANLALVNEDGEADEDIFGFIELQKNPFLYDLANVVHNYN